MSDRYGNSANSIRLASDVSVELSDLVLVDFRKLWLDESLGIDQVFLEKWLFNDLEVLLVHTVVGQHLLCQLLLDHSVLLRLLILV